MSKKVKSSIILYFIGFLIVILPLLIGIGVSLPILENIVVDNDWIGFWGTYLGSFSGGIITLYVLWRTINSNEQARKRDDAIKFFDKMIKLFAEFHESVGLMSMKLISFINLQEIDAYHMYLRQISDVAKIHYEITTLLECWQKVYDYQKLQEHLKNVIKEINFFTDEVEIEFCIGLSDLRKTELAKSAEVIMNELDEIKEELTKCIEKNLEAII